MGNNRGNGKNFSRRTVLGIGVIGLLVLSACGKSSEKTDAQSSTGEEQTSESVTVSAEPATVSSCTPISSDIETIHMMPDWQVGDSRKLEFTTGKQSSDGGQDGKLVTVFSLGVESSGSEKITFSLDSEQAVMGGELVEGGFSFQNLLYSVDNDRVLVGIENAAEVRTQIPEISPEMDQYLDSLDDESLGALLSQNANLYHLFENVELTVGEVLEGETEVPHPFGGFMIPMSLQYEVTELVDEDGCVEIEMITGITDRDKFNESIAGAMGEMLGATGQELSEADVLEIEEMLTTMNMERSAVAQYDAVSKNFNSIVFNEKISAEADGESESREETTTIVDITDE